MTKNSTKRSRSPTNQPRAKRRKQYSSRDIPWSEQEHLGELFREAGPGSWPVIKILKERSTANKKQYLVQWYRHPETKEEFKPEWLEANDIASDLKQEWEAVQEQEFRHRDRGDNHNIHVACKYRLRDLIIPDPRSEVVDESGCVSPPGLISSRESYDSIEISETRGTIFEKHISFTDYPTSPETCNEQLTKTSETSSSLTILTQLQNNTGSSYYATAPQTIIDQSPFASDTPVTAFTSPLQSSRWFRRAKKTGATLSPSYEALSQYDMATNGLRQSPRISAAVPDTSRTSTRVSTRSSSRHRTAEDKEMEPTTMHIVDSVTNVEEAQKEDATMQDDAAEEMKASGSNSMDQADSVIGDGDFPDNSNSADDPSIFDTALVSNMIHESIEEAPESSAATTLSMNSKANSSQESLNNERLVPSIDGTMIPTHPLLGYNEYAIALPAEGKVKSVYDELIKAKRKALLKFISRRGSPGTSEISNRKTSERLAMQELIQRLNDTCTHIDLGLPPLTQYSLNSPDNGSYAEYAGSKFAMLGFLVDQLKETDCSFVIMAQAGTVQDLIENFCKMKHIEVHRHDRQDERKPSQSKMFHIDLLATQSERITSILLKPSFIIAFDVSFTTSDPQVTRIRESFEESLPIIHLLVANSSEHVEKCVPESLTSNLRLRVVVRTTFLASSYLGGAVTYVPDPADGFQDGRPMDMGDLQRAVRKSPNRKMALMADVIAAVATSDNFAENWTLGGMPELQLDDLVESPPKASRAASVTPQPSTVEHKPISRASTPMGKKRYLDIESDTFTKRQRLTPVPDSSSATQSSTTTAEVSDLRYQLSSLRADLTAEQQARKAADQSRADAEAKASEWRNAVSDLQRRYEKRRTKTKELEKQMRKMTALMETAKIRQEKTETERLSLKEQLTQLRTELELARNDLKSTGGDIASLEEAREEARVASSKTTALEKSLDNTKKDFEFTRQQYQDASSKAAEMATQVSDLESQIKKLEMAANDSKRSLKAMNYDHSIKRHIEAAERIRLEVRNRDAVIKKLQEENSSLKSKRGVQTRGSSVQPGGSPGPRSRQASPAPGFLAPPSHTRASILRNER